MGQDGDSIEDPIQGIQYCNKRIKKLEQMAEEARLSKDTQLAAKCEGHIVAWMEILQHFIRQKYQQGMETEDITKPKKSRVNG